MSKFDEISSMVLSKILWKHIPSSLTGFQVLYRCKGGRMLTLLEDLSKTNYIKKKKTIITKWLAFYLKIIWKCQVKNIAMAVQYYTWYIKQCELAPQQKYFITVAEVFWEHTLSVRHCAECFWSFIVLVFLTISVSMWGRHSFYFLGPHMAYGSSQARGQVEATAASLPHSHSNSGSELCLWPIPQHMATPDL